MDDLDRENEELKDQVATLEEEKEEIEESLKSAKSQVDKLQRNVSEKEVNTVIKYYYRHFKLFSHCIN